MSASPPAPKPGGGGAKPDYGLSDGKAMPDLPPLKPRPVLFVMLAIMLVLWLGALVVMRLKTVDRPLTGPAETPPVNPLDSINRPQ